MEEIFNLKERLAKNVEIAGIRQLLKQNLSREREILLKCLQDEIDAQKPKYNDFSLLNGSKAGKGQEPYFGLYYWINLIFKKDTENEIGYCLGLCREDLDTETTNIHQDFAKLQMSKCLPRESKKGEFTTNTRERKSRSEDFYHVYYYHSRSFPTATSNGDQSIKGDNYPWNYQDFVSEEQAVEMCSEIMDRTNPKYDPMKVASFFLQLCAYDAEHSEE